jgi:biopolymer transport protein ExbD
MALSVSSPGRGRRRDRMAPLAEINVTPFVDVVLVLLIIFMLTAHVMEYGLEVDVPKTKSVRTTTKQLPIINIDKEGGIYIGKEPVNIHELGADIRQRYAGQDAVYVRAARETTWDLLAQVVSELGDAKLQVNMVTQPDDSANKHQPTSTDR